MLFKKKDARLANTERSIKLLPLDKYKNILVIIDKAEQIRHNQLHQLFSTAAFTFLTGRAEKVDSSSGKNFTFHKSDKRFGKVKNERLKDLLAIDFDLIIDLSSNENLKYFCQQISANLKAGCFNSLNNYNLDLLVKQTDSVELVVESIANQIKILTLNKQK